MTFATDDRHCRTCYRLCYPGCCWDEAFSFPEVVDQGMVCTHRCSALFRAYWNLCVYLGHGEYQLQFIWCHVPPFEAPTIVCHFGCSDISRGATASEFLSTRSICYYFSVFFEFLKGMNTAPRFWK